MVFLDTDVLIQVLRGSEAARAWLADNRNERFAIPGVAWESM